MSVRPLSVQMFCRFFSLSHFFVSDGSGYDSPEPFLTDGSSSWRAGCMTLLAALASLFLGLFYWLWPFSPSSWSSRPRIMGWAGCPSQSTTPQGSPLSPFRSHRHLNTTTNHPHCQHPLWPSHGHPSQAWLRGLGLKLSGKLSFISGPWIPGGKAPLSWKTQEKCLCTHIRGSFWFDYWLLATDGVDIAMAMIKLVVLGQFQSCNHGRMH